MVRQYNDWSLAGRYVYASELVCYEDQVDKGVVNVHCICRKIPTVDDLGVVHYT